MKVVRDGGAAMCRVTVTSYAMQEVVEKRIAVNEKGRLDLKETWKSGKIRKTAEMRGKAL